MNKTEYDIKSYKVDHIFMFQNKTFFLNYRKKIRNILRIILKILILKTDLRLNM